MVLAHRGASAYAPDHTVAAIHLAREQGADAIEADVHLSRDGHPVLHHGGDLSENTDGAGPIGRYRLTELKEFDAGYRWSPDGGKTYPYRGTGQRIIALSEALAAFPDTRFNLDIKERRAASATRKVIDDHDASRRVLLASFYSWRRSPALYAYPGPRSITLDQMMGFLLSHWTRLRIFRVPKVDALQIPERYMGLRVLTPRLIERAHRLGMKVHVWTVDHESDMERLLDWGVDGIVTKKPDLGVQVRRRRRG